jgi:hypothetical protein
VEDIVSHGRRAQTRSRVARELIPVERRAAFSPAEFAALCGRSPTWAYRQIYAARIKPISDCGRLLIPRSELDSFLARKADYNPERIGGCRMNTPLENANARRQPGERTILTNSSPSATRLSPTIKLISSARGGANLSAPNEVLTEEKQKISSFAPKHLRTPKTKPAVLTLPRPKRPVFLPC